MLKNETVQDSQRGVQTREGEKRKLAESQTVWLREGKNQGLGKKKSSHWDVGGKGMRKRQE